MISARQNQRLTRTGPGTPAGDVQRRYWQPACLTEELAGERPVKAVRLLGEDLVAFRDAQGRYGLIDRHCPHRGADLCFGRAEAGGLRCPFHGWLFDVSGQCLEMPADPDGAAFAARLKAASYPCVERNGIVFAYLGPDAPPPLPDLDCLRAPETHSFAFKGLFECNWLQALEVGIDPAHASWLHRFLEDGEASYGLQFRAPSAGSDTPLTQIMRDFPAPRLEVEATDYGLRIFALRQIEPDWTHVRVTNQLFPNAICISMSPEMILTQWHVPVDDETCYWYAQFTSFAQPVDQATMRAQRLEGTDLPAYRPKRNRSNDYGFDPHEQRTRTYTGMGEDINVHDQWACESLGAIQDRTREHLGKTDIAIIAYRRALDQAMDALEAGKPPPIPSRQPAGGLLAVDAVLPSATWRADWTGVDRKRRDQAPWSAL